MGIATFLLMLRNSVTLAALTCATTVGIYLRGQSQDRDIAAARNAMAFKSAELESVPFRRAFALFNQIPHDDPEGPFTSPGPRFDVPGSPSAKGRIEFPSDAVGQLRENLPTAWARVPRDLNADGAIDGLDHAGDYAVLPIRLVIEWRGPDGVRRLEKVVTLTESP